MNHNPSRRKGPWKEEGRGGGALLLAKISVSSTSIAQCRHTKPKDENVKGGGEGGEG